jgi:hypothetical protein
MAASSRVSRDHRQRILDHQEKIEAEQRAPLAPSSDRQLKIPLIGEVRRTEPSPPKRPRRRTKTHVQPPLGEP